MEKKLWVHKFSDVIQDSKCKEYLRRTGVVNKWLLKFNVQKKEWCSFTIKIVVSELTITTYRAKKCRKIHENDG